MLIFIGVIATASLAIMVSAFKRDETIQTSPPLDKAPTVAVFKNETLSDISRLLRPLDVSVPSAPSGITRISLRDAIYLGATNGNANLLTVWLTNSTTDNSSLLRPDDATKQLSDVSERLSRESLSGATFVVMPVTVIWKDWKLTISRTGSFVVKGTSNSISTQLQNAILKTSTTLVEANTTSVGIPVSFGLTKQTSMQPWFYNDQIIIKMLPLPAGTPADAPPDISALNGKSGFIIGQDFLNNVFAFEYKDKLLGNEKTIGIAEGEYHVQDLELLVTDGKLTVTGYLTESPPSNPTKVSLEFTGNDIGPTKFFYNIPDIPEISPELSKIHEDWDLKLSFAKSVINNVRLKPFQPLRPSEQLNLGDFLIGQKHVSGSTTLENIAAKNGAIVVTGIYRFQGGQF